MSKNICVDLQGKKVKVELFELVKDMPVTFDLIGRQSSRLSASLDYYSGFIEFTLQRLVNLLF